ncbi:MAG: GldG family protein [Saccharofermentans sp.]|nr:GldG family protein [Saccharofermentans sp.]
MNNDNTRKPQQSAPEKSGVKPVRKVNNSNHTEQTDDRAGKLKLYSIGAVILLIAIILLFNILFDGVFGKAMSFDFSDYSSNSLSQVSLDLIDSLPQDAHIRIVGFFNRPENVSGTKYQYIIPLLDDYVRKSDGKITVDYYNLNEYPYIINQLDPSNSYDLSSKQDMFVIEYNGKIKIIDPIDCYTYDSDLSEYYGKYYITGNNTEYTFTNSIYNLTNDYSFNAYIITGLKEDNSTCIAKILDSMSITVKGLPVSDNFTVPEDCDLLILNGPNNDISEKMYVSITDYLDNGGKMFVAVNYSLQNVSEKYDKLNRLLNQYNVNIDNDLISENDPAYQLGGYTNDSTVTAVDDFLSYANINMFHSTNSRSISKSEPANSNFITSPVLLTSNKASTVDLDEYGNVLDGVYNEGQYNVAMFSTGSGDDPAKIFVFGTMNFSSDEYIKSYGYNDTNVDFFKSCVKELSNSKPVNLLDVATKNVDDFSLDSSKSTTTASTVILAVFMIMIPVILVATAVIIYSKRKNL